MASADPVHAEAERMYPRISEYRIGSRITLHDLDTPHYTLVGLHLGGGRLPALRQRRLRQRARHTVRRTGA